MERAASRRASFLVVDEALKSPRGSLSINPCQPNQTLQTSLVGGQGQDRRASQVCSSQDSLIGKHSGYKESVENLAVSRKQEIDSCQYYLIHFNKRPDNLS